MAFWKCAPDAALSSRARPSLHSFALQPGVDFQHTFNELLLPMRQGDRGFERDDDDDRRTSESNSDGFGQNLLPTRWMKMTNNFRIDLFK
jgi:hypothetical protein